MINYVFPSEGHVNRRCCGMPCSFYWSTMQRAPVTKRRQFYSTRGFQKNPQAHMTWWSLALKIRLWWALRILCPVFFYLSIFFESPIPSCAWMQSSFCCEKKKIARRCCFAVHILRFSLLARTQTHTNIHWASPALLRQTHLLLSERCCIELCLTCVTPAFHLSHAAHTGSLSRFSPVLVLFPFHRTHRVSL